MEKYLFIVLLVFFWNCEDEKSDSTNNIHPLVGVWNQTEYTISNQNSSTTEILDENLISTYIFNEDYTYSYDSIDWDEIGTWSTNENKLTTLDELRNEVIIRDYLISNNILTLSSSYDLNGIASIYETKWKKQ